MVGRDVVVIGGTGALGALVCDAFTRSGWTAQPVGRTTRHRVDLGSRATVLDAIDGVPLVVNTVPHPDLTPERLVLARGGALLNLSAQPMGPGQTLVPADDPIGTVMLHAGVAPGVTNLVAADLILAHPDADELEMVFTVSSRGSGGPAAADFAHRNLTAVARHRTTTVDLAATFGRQRVLGFAEPDAGWLCAVAEPVTVSTYIHLAEAPVRRLMFLLNSMGLMSRLPRALFGNGRSTGVEEASREPVAHRVAVRRRGRLIAARDIVGRGDFRMAAAAAVVFGEAMLGLDGVEATPPGVWFPEAVLDMERARPALSRAGIAIRNAASGTSAEAGGRVERGLGSHD